MNEWMNELSSSGVAIGCAMSDVLALCRATSKIWVAVRIFHLSFTIPEWLLLPVTTVAISFRCCKRSCDVGHTSNVSGNLENVCTAFDIFHLSRTLPDLLLLPVCDGHILLPGKFFVLPEIAQRRSPPVMYRLSGIYVDIFWFPAVYYTDADESRTKLVFPDVLKTR
jgi:hypothetical protein